MTFDPIKGLTIAALDYTKIEGGDYCYIILVKTIPIPPPIPTHPWGVKMLTFSLHFPHVLPRWGGGGGISLIGAYVKVANNYTALNCKYSRIKIQENMARSL